MNKDRRLEELFTVQLPLVVAFFVIPVAILIYNIVSVPPAAPPIVEDPQPQTVSVNMNCLWLAGALFLGGLALRGLHALLVEIGVGRRAHQRQADSARYAPVAPDVKTQEQMRKELQEKRQRELEQVRAQEREARRKHAAEVRRRNLDAKYQRSLRRSLEFELKYGKGDPDHKKNLENIRKDMKP